MTTPELVSRQAELDDHCERWQRSGSLAFDTEFIRDDTYEAALCLVQVAADGEVVLIDPTANIDMSPFWKLVTDPAVATIVHAGKEDFEVCLRSSGRPPQNVFDVQIAAGMLGYGYPLSLTRLMGEVLGKRISKAQTLTNWLRRPLTEAQLHYAIEDVIHLPEVHGRLKAELEKSGRMAWAAEEFRRFEDAQMYEPPVRERLFRLKGTKRLDGLGLAVLERLVEWRDRWAEMRNRPLRALMRDDVLVEIARRRPRKASDLEVLRGFPQAHNPRVIREILTLIEEVSETPKNDWPTPFKEPKEAPMGRIMLDILSAVTRARCEEERVSHDLVCTTQRLREVLDFRAGTLKEPPALLRGWREEFIGRRLLELLDGESELHVSGWPHHPRVSIVTHNCQ